MILLWRRATESLLCLTPIAVLVNLAVGNWGWGLFLGGLWLACLLSYRWARRQEDKINEITAYIDWLEWKRSET